ncbi:MAG: FAD-binding dehydrogenase [Acidobacteriota bacterium]|nr:MAG: FAD-binding dehydrogenase [Acidobacteriota bacterium]
MDSATHQADVVIIGAGLAGLVTALELLERGRHVILVDRGRDDQIGGLARWSFGGVFVVGSPQQRRSGIRDSVELALSDWLAYGEIGAGEIWPRRWAEAYVTRSRDDVWGWLHRLGIRFIPVVHWVERGLFVPGNSVPRFHIIWGTGERLIRVLREAIERHPQRRRLKLLLHSRVTELMTTGGRIDGCSGFDEDSGAAFEARAGAVVIAAGGIAGDIERARRHWYPSWGEPPATLLNGSHPLADGALLDIVEHHGGRVTHLERSWHYAAGVHHWRPQHPEHGLSLVPPKSALWVGYDGRRLGPPPLVTGYDTRYLVETICRQPKKYSWQIMNWKIATRELAISGAEFNPAIRDRRWLDFLKTVLFGSPELVREMISACQDVVTGESVAELVEKMNELAGSDDIDPVRLREQIDRYDQNVARGPRYQNDDQLRRISHARQYRGDRVRTCKQARIDDEKGRPLIAIRELIVTRKSLGGIQTDLDARVLDRAGEPIAGLYAVGEAAGFGGGGMHGLRALEGTFLGGCILTGQVAARAIANAG